jgi:hypothetical protein
LIAALLSSQEFYQDSAQIGHRIWHPFPNNISDIIVVFINAAFIVVHADDLYIWFICANDLNLGRIYGK